MRDWFEGDSADRKALVKRFSEDREYLLEKLDLRSEHYGQLRPSEKVENVLIDICEFNVVDEALGPGQLALCDFNNRLVIVNSDLKSMIHHKTDLELLRASTLAHELGHIRLHSDEMMQGCALQYFGDSGEFTDTRAYQKEREADLYAGIFLVPLEELLREQQIQNLLRNLTNGRHMTPSALWKIIYTQAARFRVSPSLFKRCLIDFGWLTESKKTKNGLTELALGFKQ